MRYGKQKGREANTKNTTRNKKKKQVKKLGRGEKGIKASTRKKLREWKND